MKEKLSLKTKLAIPLILWFGFSGIIWLIVNNFMFINALIEDKKISATTELKHLMSVHLDENILNFSLQERIDKFRQIIKHGAFEARKIIFFTPEGKVIYSTEESEINKVFSYLPKSNDEFIEALNTGEIIAEFSYKEEEAGNFKNKILVEVYSPLRLGDNGKIVGVIEIWYLFDKQLFLIIQNSVILMVFAFVVLLFFWISMGRVLNTVLYKDFQNIYRVMNLVKKGDFSQKIETDGTKETNDLINFFNNLSETIKKNQEELVLAKESLEKRVVEQTQELVLAKQNLEKQVEEKTRTLKEKLEELEKFKNETIGRELRIVELKNELEKINKKL